MAEDKNKLYKTRLKLVHYIDKNLFLHSHIALNKISMLNRKKNEPLKALPSQCPLFLPLVSSFFPKPSSPFPSKLANKALGPSQHLFYSPSSYPTTIASTFQPQPLQI